MSDDIAPPQAVFAEVFRSAAYATIEYSLGPNAAEFGTMIGGQQPLLPQVRRFLGHVSFAGEWYWMVEQFISVVRPDTFLFKADWNGGSLESVTLYCRFPESVNAEHLARLFDAWPPLAWNGPSTDALSELFEVPGPRGIGFRCGRDSASHSALYFRVPAALRQFRRQKLAKLVALCGFDPSRMAEIEEASRDLYGAGPVGVVGFDSAPPGGCVTLKLDPSNVPLRVVLAWLGEYDTPPGYLNRITGLACGLRLLHASYFGLKFNSSGLAGWKLYLALSPRESPVARLPQVPSSPEYSAATRFQHH